MSNRKRTRNSVMPYMHGPEFRQTVTGQLFAKFRSGTAYIVKTVTVRVKNEVQPRPVFHRVIPKVRAQKSPNKPGYQYKHEAQV